MGFIGSGGSVIANFIERRKRYISEIPEKTKNSLSYKLRKILYPYINYSVTVQGNLNEKYIISEKEIDDKVLSGLLDLYYDLYFPSNLDPSKIDTVWDLGAHHGYYSIRSLYEYPNSKVISVEPNINSYKVINDEAKLNNVSNRITILNTALSDKDEKLKLFLSEKGSWGDSLYLEGDSSKKCFEVDTITFQTLLGHGVPDIIKCNAEGAEYILIDELEKNDIKPKALILMVHPEFGNPDELLGKGYFNDYEKDDTYSTKKRLRYLFTKKIEIN